jgi:hypothetical protein
MGEILQLASTDPVTFVGAALLLAAVALRSE